MDNIYELLVNVVSASKPKMLTGLNQLDPISECKADKCSDGFRKKRSAHDAIEGCYNALRLKRSPKWIFEADVKGCYDNILHIWLHGNIPTDQKRLTSWLGSPAFLVIHPVISLL
ncbi:MAG: hypothetical protein B6245_20420 [Desulfobacteraceae bacterium 4572_88]|nr:MAG: hypothetical protein B6245_20420 [Desulfobacteraceae bacterium 4572_88]